MIYCYPGSLPYRSKICLAINIPFYKRLFSYVYPLSLRKTSSAINPHLELLLYRNQIQLATPDAFYSDGVRYEPAVAAVKHLKSFLPGVKNALVLGTGIGSLVRVMAANNYKPAYDLVELDEVVLEMAMELLSDISDLKINPICTDAEKYLKRNNRKYEFIFIDIFNGRVVPDFVSQPLFLSACFSALAPAGCVAFNYIVNDNSIWNQTVTNFSAVFANYTILDLGINKILIGRK